MTAQNGAQPSLKDELERSRLSDMRTDLSANDQRYEKQAVADSDPLLQSVSRQQTSVSQNAIRKEEPAEKSGTTLTELLQAKTRRKDRDPSPLYGASGTTGLANSYMPGAIAATVPATPPLKQQVNMDNKSKKRKNVLNQKEPFKLDTIKCYQGTRAYSPEKYSAPNIPTWQDAIACLEDLGIDMTAHH